MRKNKKRGKQLLLISLVALMIFGLGLTAAIAEENSPDTAVEVQKIFTDVDTADSNAIYINYLSNKKILTGFPDGSYHPEEGLTRAQAATVVIKAAGLQAPAVNDSGFKDVAAEHWAAANIAAAARAGYIKGFPDGSYHPEEELTRAQGIALIMRLSSQKDQAELPVLTDMNNSHWAAKEMGTAIAAEMIEPSSDGSIKPEATMNRGSLAKALGTLLSRDPGQYSTELNGSLKEIEGTVELVRNGKSSIITEATTVYEGDTIKTGNDSRARLTYPDGSGTLIKEKSEVVIKEARGREYIKKDGSPGIAVDWLNLEVPRGTLFGALATQQQGKAQANAALQPDNYPLLADLSGWSILADANNQNLPWYQASQAKKVKMQVDMPWGVAAIRGTFIRVIVHEDGSCDVSCLTGDAEMIGQDAAGNCGSTSGRRTEQRYRR